MDRTYMALCQHLHGTTQRCTKTSDAPIHTPMRAAAMHDAALPIRSNLGLNVMPKDTMTDWEGAGFEPPTLQLLDRSTEDTVTA